MRYYSLCGSCHTLTGPHEGLMAPRPGCCAQPTIERWPSVDALRSWTLLAKRRQEASKAEECPQSFSLSLSRDCWKTRCVHFSARVRYFRRESKNAGRFFRGELDEGLWEILTASGLPKFERDWRDSSESEIRSLTATSRSSRR